jgi:tetratricopeptide (TPR) repeat protein
MNDLNKIKLLVKELQNLFFIKNFGKIIKEAEMAIKKYPKISIFYNLMGLALTQLGKNNEAKLILEKGLKVNPSDLAIINNLANVNKNIFNYIEAEKLYKLSISKKKDYINAYVNYGNLEKDLNKFNNAISLYKTSLIYNNKIPEVFYSLAMANQSLGNFKESELYAYKTLELDKRFTKADLLISRSKKYFLNDNHLKSMIEKIKLKELSQNQKIDLYFALAKAYEDFGKIKESFNYLELGNKLKRDIVKFNLDDERRKFKRVKEIFIKVNSDKLLKNNQKSNKTNQGNKNIIFILGMPRSGTTLTEQIISSHSKIYGSGELPYLSKILKEKFFDDKNLTTSNIEKFDHTKLSEITNSYFSYLKNYEISENWITDKAPLNFMWIGFINKFIPNAKIIHCKRAAKDNCVSLFKNVFDGDLNFCYTQKELGNFYNLYLDWMNFWKKQIPNSFLEIEYEQLIKNTKEEAIKIFNFCKLDWNDDCLDLSKNKTPIKTASVGQARKKIYSSSVNSYLKYKEYLGELFTILKKKPQ